MNITEPLRLAVGSHQAGSGKGCAMNVISWENGDTAISDLPACSDPLLARIVQRVNDEMCTHRDGDLLCAACSIEVLALGHRTVGTTSHGHGLLALRQVYVCIAADQARQVQHLNTDPRVEAAIAAAEAWVRDPTYNVPAYAAYAAHAAAATAATAYAAYAAATANATANAAANATANATANANASDAAYANAAYAYATYATANASDAAYADRFRLAHRAIDLFLELTGITEQQPDNEATSAAIANMLNAETVTS